MERRLVFGYASAEGRARHRLQMAQFAKRLGELCNVEIDIQALASYDELAQFIHHREIDLAWLSPIPLISLARNRRIVPLVSLNRGRSQHYRCALITHASSHISTYEEMRGRRAAWVDRFSASGYVLPRIRLASHDIGPRQLGDERFFGSHDAVVRAVASGRADFGATFTRQATNGEHVGPWSVTAGLTHSIRVMKTFGEVPPDAIATRYDLDRALRDRLSRALRGMAKTADDMRVAHAAFGVDTFDTPRRPAYEALRTTVFRAYELGFLESNAMEDGAILNVAATIEARAVTPSRKKLALVPDDTIETPSPPPLRPRKPAPAKRLP